MAKATFKKWFLFLCFICSIMMMKGGINLDSLSQIYTNDEVNQADRISAAFAIAKTHRYKKSAAPYYHNALEWSKQIKNKEKEASSLWQLGIIYYNQTSYDTASLFYSKALTIYDQLELENERATMLRNLGKIDSKKGQWIEAIDKYQQALKIEESIGNQEGIASVLNLIGSIHRKQKNYDDALEYLQKAYDKAKLANVISTQVDALGNIATTYQEIDSIELAASYFDKTLQLSRENKLERRVAICLMTLGQIHQLAGDNGRSKPFLEEANALYLKLGNIKGTAPIKASLGKIEIAEGNPQKAIIYCEESFELATKAGSVTMQKTALDCLVRSYEAAGDFKKANEYFKKLDDLKTEFYKESSIQEVTELQMNYAFEKKKEIATLEQEQKDIRQSWIRNVLIAGLLGVLLLSFLIFRSAQTRKKNNAILAEKNAIISKALSEKDLLLREIHHRVKNNLQVVSSLLSMQSRFVEDESAKMAINEGRNRVKSMALIHQNLYQEDNLTGIEVKDYFEKLAKSLFNSYNISPDIISLELDIEPLNLDVDTVIPLGLIVNELISNSLKHAFPNERQGLIKVSLIEEFNKSTNQSLLILTVADNGIGADMNKLNETSKSFGFRMINAFKDKLEADLNITSNNGTVVSMSISEYQKAS